jgi:predicted PolB exonuclease-like 3'-5' exonuclease
MINKFSKKEEAMINKFSQKIKNKEAMINKHIP